MHAPKADGTKHREFYTTYSKQNLSRGKTTTAAMVVLPLEDHEDASRCQNLGVRNRHSGLE